MSYNLNNEEPHPIEKPKVPPTTSYDPLDPEEPTPTPVPLPPDSNPQPNAPVREPDQPLPVLDPQPSEPTRLL